MTDNKINLPDNLILNLPDLPDFVSEAPAYTPAELIALCERMLPIWNVEREKNPPPLGFHEPFILKE